MKTTTRIPAPIQAYTDEDGKPICGDCSVPAPCEFYKDVEITPDTIPNEPGPTCPVWGEGSKEVVE